MLLKRLNRIVDLAEHLRFKILLTCWRKSLAAFHLNHLEDNLSILHIHVYEQNVCTLLVLGFKILEQFLVKINGNHEGLIKQAPFFLLEQTFGECDAQHLKSLVLGAVNLHENRAADSPHVLQQIFILILLLDVYIELPEMRLHQPDDLACRLRGQERRDAGAFLPRNIVQQIRHITACCIGQVIELGPHILVKSNNPIRHIMHKREQHLVLILQ